MENLDKELADYRHILADLRNIAKDGSLIVQRGEYADLLINAVASQIGLLNSIAEASLEQGVEDYENSIKN